MIALSSLAEVCKRLNENRVDYVVVGGFAIILHGYQRATIDIDLLVESSKDNVAKIKNALHDILPEACKELNDEDVASYIVVRMGGDELIVDLMAKIKDIDFSKAIIDTEEIDGIKIPFADLETLIQMKQGVREKDKQDLLFLKGKKEFLEKNDK
jgi:predicted nucleotidyltransferase